MAESFDDGQMAPQAAELTGIHARARGPLDLPAVYGGKPDAPLDPMPVEGPDHLLPAVGSPVQVDADFDGEGSVGATHRRKALAFGGLHPPYKGGFRPLAGQTLIPIPLE